MPLTVRSRTRTPGRSRSRWGPGAGEGEQVVVVGVAADRWHVVWVGRPVGPPATSATKARSLPGSRRAGTWTAPALRPARPGAGDTAISRRWPPTWPPETWRGWTSRRPGPVSGTPTPGRPWTTLSVYARAGPKADKVAADAFGRTFFQTRAQRSRMERARDDDTR